MWITHLCSISKEFIPLLSFKVLLILLYHTQPLSRGAQLPGLENPFFYSMLSRQVTLPKHCNLILACLEIRM